MDAEMKRARDDDVGGVVVPTADLRCPITQSVMCHPALAHDGHTYEHAAIRRWFLRAQRPTSPLTGLRMESTVLVANVTMRKICAAAMETFSESERTDALRTAAEAAAMDDRELARMCARVEHSSGTATDTARGWSRAMDGDQPEDVARMLVATLLHAEPLGPSMASGLSALRLVASVSRSSALEAGATDVALRALSSHRGAGPCVALQAALQLIVALDGGSAPGKVLTLLRREVLQQAGGLAALAAVLPRAAPEDAARCEPGVAALLRSSGSALVAAAMRPAAAMLVNGSEQLRDALVEALIRWHAHETVMLAGIKALRSVAPRLKLDLSIALQLLRLQASARVALREEATALVRDVGLLTEPEPPPANNGAAEEAWAQFCDSSDSEDDSGLVGDSDEDETRAQAGWRQSDEDED